MTRPPAAGFAGREKWGEALVDLLLAGAGVLLVAVAVPELDGTRPRGLWLLVAYTVWAVAVTVVLALAVGATRRLPELSDEALDGRPAVVVRTWAAPWWHATALDAGLAVLGPALALTGFAAGGDWAVVGLLPGAVGLWFLGRVVLVLLGRRRRPALWLSDDEVVVDSYAGRARAARADVRTARGAGRRLVVTLDREATWVLVPRPWRGGGMRRDTLVLDCADTAHRAADLAAWLTHEVADAGPGRFDTVPEGRDPESTTPARPPRSGPFRDQRPDGP